MDTPIPEFLAEAANKRVSDIFIIAGRPLAEKIDGHLFSSGDRLMPAETEALDVYKRQLLSCVERMAFGADLNVDVLFSRTCYESVSAVAGYSCLIVVRMDSFSHDFHLSIYLILFVFN